MSGRRRGLPKTRAAAPVTRRAKPARSRSRSTPGRAILVGVLILMGVLLVTFVAGAARGADPTETTLENVSAGSVVRVRTGGRIMDVPVELYVARVVAGEGEPRAGDAAQQALAIAVRTYALANAGRHRRDGFELCDTTHCQVLRPTTASSRRAALETAGQVLMYGGRPADVFYSASCGGRSEAASQVWPGALDHPYLQSVKDDVHEEETPWTTDIQLVRVERALRRIGFEGQRLRDVRIEGRSESGRVTRLQLAGLRPNRISADDFRAAIGARELRSTQFTVRKNGKSLRFTGRGYGHGVGMCVIGAGLRAARGESAQQILEQYFPGLQLEIVSATGPVAPVVTPEPEHEAVPALNPIERMAAKVRDEIAGVLGISDAPQLRVQVHDTLDAFRHATGRPWWVSAAVDGTAIDLAPAAILAQRDGVEAALRRGVVEALIRPALADRPAWVRVGAARYYSAPTRMSPGSKAPRCPSDPELTMAVSATAQREAELRAEACFAHALDKAGSWRDVR